MPAKPGAIIAAKSSLPVTPPVQASPPKIAAGSKPANNTPAAVTAAVIASINISTNANNSKYFVETNPGMSQKTSSIKNKMLCSTRNRAEQSVIIIENLTAKN
jgi:hypothetical protein